MPYHPLKGDRASLVPHLWSNYSHLSFRNVIRSNTLSDLYPLHRLHIDWRLLMSWLGGSLGVMWSMVQSQPSRSLPHREHTGSNCVLAYARALAHSLDECQSAILLSPYLCLYHVVACLLHLHLIVQEGHADYV